MKCAYCGKEFVPLLFGKGAQKSQKVSLVPDLSGMDGVFCNSKKEKKTGVKVNYEVDQARLQLILCLPFH